MIVIKLAFLLMACVFLYFRDFSFTFYRGSQMVSVESQTCLCDGYFHKLLPSLKVELLDT